MPDQTMSKKRERVRRAIDAATQLRILVGCVIESLEFYDSDDGHNEIVFAGVVARLREIEDKFEDVLFDRVGQARRRRERSTR